MRNKCRVCKRYHTTAECSDYFEKKKEKEQREALNNLYDEEPDFDLEPDLDERLQNGFQSMD